MAFLYSLTGDEVWAAHARDFVERRIYDTTAYRSGNWGWGLSIKGLHLYWAGQGVALAYDMCYDAPSWDRPGENGAFLQTENEKLVEQAVFVFQDGGREQNNSPASTWQGIRGASACLMLLAIDVDYSVQSVYDQMYQKVVTYLQENHGTHPGSRGWNIEGLGYTMYPWTQIGPMGIAAKRLGQGDLNAATPGAMDYTLWTVYAAAAQMERESGIGLHPDFSDDNANLNPQGSLGLAFFFSPEELHPGFVYWYDRIVGENGDQSWDNERAGTMYSILFHPGDTLDPVNPMKIDAWLQGFLDDHGNGFYTFRNDYSDSDDRIAQIYGKFRGAKGHNGPDALSFRIMGLDTPWAVGGGRYGIRTAANNTGVQQHV